MTALHILLTKYTTCTYYITSLQRGSSSLNIERKAEIIFLFIKTNEQAHDCVASVGFPVEASEKV